MPTASFGQWLKRRRRALDMTQEELAQRVGCAEVTIFKIEADERRPSKQIAQLLAQQLAIPPPDGDVFVKFARSGPAAAPGATPWGTSFHPPTNVPIPPTPLIGREQDIANVRRHLLRDDTQLLTLVGPPGIGKTRLSLAVAGDVLDEFPDGVFVIWLAPIRDPDLVPQTMVRRLGIQEVGPQTSLERLTIHLRDKQTLLVLDNFEHILAAAPQVAELLAACPDVKMLVTSRAPLRIRRERQFPVLPLALPDPNRFPEVETLLEYPAVALFVERAQAVKPDFSLTQDNAPAVAAICNRLDGLPLAIELISARVKVLPPSALLEQLRGRLMLQSDGVRDMEPRHRTLSAAIDWSYDLLDTQLKTLFMRLGVFAGGWTIEAAETVCPPEISTLDGVASLLDMSLVQQTTGFDGEPRYIMLETIREYALECLEASGESQEIRRQHAIFFLALAETAHCDSPLSMPLLTWLDAIDQDYDNVRVALEWSFRCERKTGLHLALATLDYWLKRGRVTDGRYWLEKSLEVYHSDKMNSPNLLMDILVSVALLAYFQDDLVAMRQHAETLLTLGRKEQNTTGIRNALFSMGQEALQQRDYERANTVFEEVLSLSRPTGITHYTASALLMLSRVAIGQKDYRRALALNTESMGIYRQLGDKWGESLTLGNLGLIREQEGNYHEARAFIRQSLRISSELGDKRTLSGRLEHIAEVMSLEGEHQSAARLMGAAEALRESIFVAVEPLDDFYHDRRVERVRASLDEPTFAAAWAEGRLMTLEQAIAYALEAHTPPTEQAGKSETASPASPSLPEPLNARELEVLSLVASGLSNREIAGQLFLTVNTVKWYLKGIFGKLQVANRTQAVARAQALGLLSQE